MNYEQITGEGQPMEEDENVDPIWTSSRTARQIYALTMVEKDISKLLALAASSVSLLTLPQTDPPESTLPQGEERSEQFVVEVTEYFNKLDSISQNMRWVLAQIAKARIAPSAIEAPPPSFIPQPMGRRWFKEFIPIPKFYERLKVVNYMCITIIHPLTD
ncbi:mediator complex [Pyrrhoderma noxium]|uniref:Mediator of RNA polymerase II transcription subunit 11 n=1 Tax=Pyrrhoderma noxium TaxID=2282107 RepID=A0A286UR87_9AGAM|nr:mediator complex [Pyrrhoderma noxium]